LITAAMVLAMAVIGAITRLTGSGLSMVEWRPLMGTLPPMSESEWRRVFNLYQQSPEYRLVNAGMSLDAFKYIFFWEWFHRLWGRLIGVVFAVPLAFFWLTGRLDNRLKWTLSGLLILGALQGVMGWVMVMSGLVDTPAVSHYRLAAHLGLAFIIFGLLILVALSVLRHERQVGNDESGLLSHAWAALMLLAITIVFGAFVAGMKAGLSYNTFPLMQGRFFPPDALAFSPAWLNLFENMAMVQFIHRWLAVVTAITILVLWWRSRIQPLNSRTRTALLLTAISVIAQVGLGIATLVLAVPLTLATLHQGVAFVLVGALVWAMFELTHDRTPIIAHTVGESRA
jgi:heme a synthase